MEKALFEYISGMIREKLPDVQILEYFSREEREKEYIAVGISPAGDVAPGMPFVKMAVIFHAGCNRQEEETAANRVRELLEVLRNLFRFPVRGAVLKDHVLDGIVPDGNPGSITVDENDRYISGELNYTAYTTKQ